MFKSYVKYCFILLSGIFLWQCSNTQNSDELIVAQVGEKKLLSNELAEIIPSSMNKQDSILIAGDYIRKWIQQELLIQKANENLSSEQKNLDREIQEYRNSLIIYKYKNELMKQRMDTLVTKAQIEKYYNENPDNFNLNKNIVKAVFIKIPNEVVDPKLLKKMAEDTSEEGLTDLREYCVRYAKRFDIFADNWVDFELLNNNIPQEIRNTEQIITRNKQIEFQDSNYYYLVSIHDYKLQNDLAPLEFVENNIKNLILNQRKIKFLKEIEENIYKEGIRQNKFKIYKGKTDDTE